MRGSVGWAASIKGMIPTPREFIPEVTEQLSSTNVWRSSSHVFHVFRVVHLVSLAKVLIQSIMKAFGRLSVADLAISNDKNVGVL